MNEKRIHGNQRGDATRSMWNDDYERKRYEHDECDRADATNDSTGACRSEDRRHVYRKRI